MGSIFLTLELQIFDFRIMKNISNDISCIPIEFSTIYMLSGNNDTFPTCTEQVVKNFNKAISVLPDLLDTCSRACKTFQYTGTMKQYHNFTNSSKEVYLSYWFNHKDEVEVFEEYQIYEITSVIGSIGGTLGLFVGFSFFDISTKLINILKDHFLNVSS